MNVVQIKIVLVVLLSTLTNHALCNVHRHSEELWQALESTTDIEEKTKIYNDLSRSYISVNIDSAKILAREGMALCLSTGNLKQLPRLYNAIAIAAINEGAGELALQYLDSALYFDEKFNNKSGLAGTLGNKGSVLYMLGRYSDSQKLQFRALKLYEELQDKSAIATTWSNIHGTYFVLKDWDNARKSAHLALSYFDSLGEKDGIAIMSYDLGCLFIELGQIDSAEYYAQKSLSIFRALEQDEGIADGNRILADVFRGKGNLNDAKKLVIEAIQTYQDIGSHYKKIQSLILLANIEHEGGNDESALQYADEALPECRSMGSRQFIRDILSLKMQIFSSQNRFQEYHEIAKEYLPLRDSILNEESIEAIKRVESEYEVERHIRENINLKQQQDILNLKLHQKNTRIIVWSLILILIILTVYWYFQYRKQKQIQLTLELRQKLLQSQMNPHFVFNSLSAIQSFMYVNEPIKAAKFLSSFASLMRGIMDHASADWITLEKECNWLTRYLEIQKLRFDDKFEFAIDIDENLIPSQTKVPAMLVQPFVENAIEHGFKNISYPGKIEIKFLKVKHQLQVTVLDNGRGIENTSTTNNTEELHAMKITRERLKILNRNLSTRIELHLRSSENEGTEVKFVIPLIEN